VLKKNYKLSLLFSFFLFLFIFNGSFALALEVSDYPNIPGLTQPTENDLPSYISYLFGVAVYIAGAIALISFAVGAVQLAMAASNPSLANNAKDRMKGSILGLILTLSAFVILRTINPTLITPTLTALPETDGLFYTNGSSYTSAPTSEGNTSNIPKGYRQLAYRCSNGPILLIWKFPNTNFEGNDQYYNGVTVVRKKCGEVESLAGVGSFKTTFETPGIYYCMGECSNNMCSGYMSESTSSSGELPSPFKNNLKSIRIINNPADDVHYGIIFHSTNDPTVAGSCSQPLFSIDTNKDIECFNNISNSSSSTVFFWNDKDFKSSGQGIDFYSEPFGWSKGSRAGKHSLGVDTIKNYWTGEAQDLTLSYSGIERPSGYKNVYQNFQQHSGSINVKGNYAVVLWSGSTCQVFFKDITNLKSTEITASVGNIGKINIIPVK